MIKIFRNTKIYIAAPSAFATGGPELLHQLAYHLRKDLGIEAYIYYYPDNIPNPVHPAFKIYSIPYVKNIEDNESNILIVPEIISGINLLDSYSNIRKIIWWLSVDNFYLSIFLNSRKHYIFKKLINKASNIILKRKIFDINELILQNIDNIKLTNKIFQIVENINLNLVQSHYALNHINIKYAITQNKIAYLSDYLNQEFLKIQTELSKKENIVVYNPQKGISFTKKIILNANNIKFIPIINMSRENVIKTLQRAKVYIDFGNHPGKDRMPREAAILGCCVITGKRGSAAFYEDVPIPDEYKFDDKEENIPKIIEKIKDCFANFEERHKDFDYYREVIKNEPQKFVEDLKKIFLKVDKDNQL